MSRLMPGNALTGPGPLGPEALAIRAATGQGGAMSHATTTPGELEREATIKQYFIVQSDGKRSVSRQVEHCSLPAILTVGYRDRKARRLPAPLGSGGAEKRWANLTRGRDLSRVRSMASSGARATGACCPGLRGGYPNDAVHREDPRAPASTERWHIIGIGARDRGFGDRCQAIRYASILGPGARGLRCNLCPGTNVFPVSWHRTRSQPCSSQSPSWGRPSARRSLNSGSETAPRSTSPGPPPGEPPLQLLPGRADLR